MDEYLGIALLVNTALSFIVSHVASVRGKSSGGFFALSFLASFLVGILVLIALTGGDNSSGNSSNKERKNCPFCDEAISPSAKICQFCKSNVVVHFEELAQRNAAVQAQDDKDAAEKSEALSLEEKKASELSEQKRLQEAQSRKLLVAKLLRSPIAWVTTVLLVIGSVGTFLLVTQESRQEAREAAQELDRVADLEAAEFERVQALMDFDCTISKDDIQVNFERYVEIDVQLPPDCHTGVRTALEQNAYPSKFGGDTSIRVFLDGELVSSKLLRYLPENNNYATLVPDQTFHDYLNEFETEGANLRVEAEFIGGNLRSDPTSLTVVVPQPEKGHKFFHFYVSDHTLGGLARASASSRHTLDRLFFDWPGDEFDEMVELPHNGSSYTTTSSAGAEFGRLTVTGYIDGVAVQIESGDY